MKGIYLGACRAYHPNYDLDYNDIISGYHINIVCDMLDIDLTKYDFIIASPPCNFYSHANYRRYISEYSQKTKHLLPNILLKCVGSGKPFIVENVRNYNLFKKEGIIKICDDYGIITYGYGRHTYFTNVMFNPSNIFQQNDNIQYISNSKKTYREGGLNVFNVIEFWLKIVNS